MQTRSSLILIGIVFGLPPLAAAEPDAATLAFFEKEVRPLLVEQCQKCHGAKRQESSLRVDSREALMKGGESGPAIVPGTPAKSLLLQVVRHVGDIKMPPVGKLREDQISALAKWIELGAPWPGGAQVGATRSGEITDEDRRFWSFQPIKNPPIPTVKDVAWPITPIDRFVLARLDAKGMRPVRDASRRTLLRRATFDLTGLPPTPEEIQAFLHDDSPTAFEKVIDRLLASPHYGERWGRHWLDVARYADTAGDGADYPVREAYLYRNWVIRALNADMPYDQFVREQLAGDLIARDGPPEKYADRVIATGFLAIGKRYGYQPSPTFQHLDFADVIESVGRSLLGLTLGCARCHDHKYDPVNVGDYYALYGILQSTTWAFPGGEEQKRPSHFPPLVPPDEAAAREKTRAERLAGIDAELAKLKRERDEASGTQWAGGVDLGFEGQTLGKPPSGSWMSAGPNSVLAEAQSPYAHVHPAGTRGVRLNPGAVTDGIRMVFPTAHKAGPGSKLHFNIDFRNLPAPANTGAYRFFLSRGVLASLALECSVTANEFAIRNGDSWEVVRKLEPNVWYNLQLDLDLEKRTYGGRIGKPGDVTTFAGKKLVPAWDGTIDVFISDGVGHAKGTPPPRDLDNLGLQATPFGPLGSSPVAAPAARPDRKERLAKLEAALAEKTKHRAAVAAEAPYPVAYGVSEGKPVNARIQRRGEPERPGPETPRRFLEILGGDPLPADAAGSGRRELAEWITRPTNPLTMRVLVNRVWQWHFGQGLVPTASDFGTRGDAPSHPELLDHLATWFLQNGQSLKALHRYILRSHVYRLASEENPAQRTADPKNRLLWQFTRRPLDAESIRDTLLALSGKLDQAMPAGHPFPDVNTWGFTIHNPFHAIYDSNHRSIYLMVQRNRRHPYLALFDAADPNQSTAERLPTTTPTQALYLMNAPFVHDQANGFASRLLTSPGDDGSRIRLAFEYAHGRAASDAEVQDALNFLAGYRNRLPRDAPPVQAWAGLARVLMTSNGLLFVD